MAGMEGLGKLYDAVPVTAGKAMKFRGHSAIGFLCTGNDTFTITVSPTFGGAYVSPGAIINHFYQRSTTDGTVAWTRQTLAASNAVVQANAGYTTYFEVLTSMISDPNAYIKVSVLAAGLVAAIPHDPVVQRKAANLEVLGA